MSDDRIAASDDGLVFEGPRRFEFDTTDWPWEPRRVVEAAVARRGLSLGVGDTARLVAVLGEWQRERSRLAAEVERLRGTLHVAVRWLGPRKAGCSGCCDGCQYEMTEALIAAVCAVGDPAAAQAYRDAVWKMQMESAASHPALVKDVPENRAAVEAAWERLVATVEANMAALALATEGQR